MATVGVKGLMELNRCYHKHTHFTTLSTHINYKAENSQVTICIIHCKLCARTSTTIYTYAMEARRLLKSCIENMVVRDRLVFCIMVCIEKVMVPMRCAEHGGWKHPIVPGHCSIHYTWCCDSFRFQKLRFNFIQHFSENPRFWYWCRFL